MPARYTTRRWIFVSLILVGVLGLFFNSQKGRANVAVDLLLVIALDVSASVDRVEYELMVRGLANALSSAEVAQAVSSGKHGAIAINVVQWSGFQEQEVKIDWTRVTGAAELGRLAMQVKDMKRRYRGGATDIGGGLEFSAELFNRLPFESERKVIDVVGDGPNNVNFSPTRARDRIVRRGIVINALAITASYEILAKYFGDLVIGGKGSFVEKTVDFDGFERAIRRKLLREIGDLLLF